MEALYEEVRTNPSKPDIHFTTIYPFYVDTGLAKDPKYRFILKYKYIQIFNFCIQMKYE